MHLPLAISPAISFVVQKTDGREKQMSAWAMNAATVAATAHPISTWKRVRILLCGARRISWRRRETLVQPSEAIYSR